MRYLFILMVFFSANLLSAKEMAVLFNEPKAPFVFRDNSGKLIGIEIDIMRAIFEKLGHSFTPIAVPNKKLLNKLKKYNAVAATSVHGKDGEGLFYSKDFIVHENFAISKKNKNIVINGLKDLDQYSFVIWQRGWDDLGPDFKASYRPDPKTGFKPNYNEVGQESQNKMFWSDRVDLILVDKAIFEYYRKKLSPNFNTNAELTYHDIFKSNSDYSITKVLFSDKKLRDDFDRTLKEIKSDGTYEKIFSNYR